MLFFQLLTTGAEKVARSTAEAFAQFYEQYLPKVFRYVSYRITDKSTAEDLTSTVFEKALVKFKSYDTKKATLATWVFTIARNTLTDHFRVRVRTQTVPLEHAASNPSQDASPEEKAVQAEERKLLKSYISKLSSAEQEIISLKFGADMTNRNIAGMTGLSESNVAVILYRAIHKLKADFQRQVQ